MKIILSGGGTLGPVTPLLAIKKIIQENQPEAEFVWVGTKTGPERQLIEKNNIEYHTLSSGKYRRYLSFWNITDLFRIIIGFFQSLKLLIKTKPDLCISAGGFISVPIHFAAFFLKIPTWIHQQDIEIGLSNKLMAPFAKIITVSLEQNKAMFNEKKVIWLGNPVRKEVLSGEKELAYDFFHLDKNLPTIFVMGGGTGSLRINQLIVEAIPSLEGFCQIIHLTGKDRPQELVEGTSEAFSNFYKIYKQFDNEMPLAYAVSDIIISRGGFASLSEIAALEKPAIIIPKQGHQQMNVSFLENKEAIIHLDENATDGNQLATTIKELLEDEIHRKTLGINLKKTMPTADDEKILTIIKNLIPAKNK